MAARLRQTERIQADLGNLRDNPLPFIQNLNLAVVEELNELDGVLIGPQNSPYDGGHFRITLRYPPEYPFRPPDMFIRTAILHPNVDVKTGTVCIDTLMAKWRPNVTLSTILTEIHRLLAEPCYETPINAADPTDKSPEKARSWTQEFAKPMN